MKEEFDKLRDSLSDFDWDELYINIDEFIRKELRKLEEKIEKIDKLLNEYEVCSKCNRLIKVTEACDIGDNPISGEGALVCEGCWRQTELNFIDDKTT